jgi:hypothetical protein
MDNCSYPHKNEDTDRVSNVMDNDSLNGNPPKFVTPTAPLTSPGTNPHFADITYKFQVEK